MAILWPLVVLVIAFGAFITKPWQEKPAQTVSVTSQGKAESVPQIAKISATISSRASSAQEAQNQTQTKTTTLIVKLQEAGIKKEDIKTESVSANPVYNYQLPTPQITGYEAQNSLTVTIQDLAAADQIISTLTANGVTSFYGPNLEVDEGKLEEAKSQARQKAIEAGTRKAQDLAKLSDRKLGKVIRVAEEGDYLIPPPIPLAVGGAEMVQKQISQIEPGQKEVSITLKIDFELK